MVHGPRFARFFVAITGFAAVAAAQDLKAPPIEPAGVDAYPAASETLKQDARAQTLFKDLDLNYRGKIKLALGVNFAIKGTDPEVEGAAAAIRDVLWKWDGRGAPENFSYSNETLLNYKGTPLKPVFGYISEKNGESRPEKEDQLDHQTQFLKQIRPIFVRYELIAEYKAGMAFGILVDGKPVNDQDEERRIRELLKPLFALSGDRAPEGITITKKGDLELKEKNDLAARKIEVRFYHGIPKDVLRFDAADQAWLQFRLRRHLLALEARWSEVKKIEPKEVAWPRPKFDERPAFRPEALDVEYTADEFARKHAPYFQATLLPFLKISHGDFAELVASELAKRKVIARKAVAFSDKEGQILLGSDTIRTNGGKIEVAITGFNESLRDPDKSYLLFQALLQSMPKVDGSRAAALTLKVLDKQVRNNSASVDAVEMQGWLADFAQSEKTIEFVDLANALKAQKDELERRLLVTATHKLGDSIKLDIDVVIERVAREHRRAKNADIAALLGPKLVVAEATTQPAVAYELSLREAMEPLRKHRGTAEEKKALVAKIQLAAQAIAERGDKITDEELKALGVPKALPAPVPVPPPPAAPGGAPGQP